MTSKEQRFWLLFGEYERLVEEESFSLKEHNLPYMDTILRRKQSVLEAMSLLEESIDNTRDDWPEFQQRLRAVKGKQASNIRLLNELREDVGSEIKAMSARQSRLKQFRHSYTQEREPFPSRYMA